MVTVKQIEEGLNTKLSELLDTEKFTHLTAKIAVEASNAHSGFVVKSDASMGMSGSYDLEKVLKDFVKEKFDGQELEKGIDVRITIDKKKQPAKEETKGRDEKDPKTMFVAVEPKYKLENVILAEDTRKNIDDAIATIQNFDLVYNQWNFKKIEPSSKTNICFWGAPGTGKTMCAHAIAQYLGKKILIASYADIQSEYVGVGPKNLRAVFQQAEENNALLFFDEADSFLRKRTSDNNSSASMHYNSMTNEMMKHLEDFNGVVIFATNLTENTDEAFKTRISYSVEFKLPDEECRAKMIKGMIPAEVPLAQPFTDEDLIEMAKSTDKFAGRDIRNAVKAILSVGAQKGEYPFKKEAFLEGFKNYSENKEGFNKGMGKDKGDGSNPMDIYTANGCIHTLLTYAAWIDGPETEKETERLKHYSKILTRTKLNINKLSDLADLDEILQGIKDLSLKKKAILFLASFMAETEQKEENLELIGKVANILNLNEEVLQETKSYFAKIKEVEEIKNKINNIK